MAARPGPVVAWLATLSNAHWMSDDIPAAAAAMEAPASLDPSNCDGAEKPIRLYGPVQVGFGPNSIGRKANVR